MEAVTVCMGSYLWKTSTRGRWPLRKEAWGRLTWSTTSTALPRRTWRWVRARDCWSSPRKTSRSKPRGNLSAKTKERCFSSHAMLLPNLLFCIFLHLSGLESRFILRRKASLFLMIILRFPPASTVCVWPFFFFHQTCFVSPNSQFVSYQGFIKGEDSREMKELGALCPVEVSKKKKNPVWLHFSSQRPFARWAPATLVTKNSSAAGGHH